MTWAKQTIIVQKTHAKDREDAKGIAKGFSDRMYTSRETGTSYRFRQKHPSHFIPGSFRVKSIPKKGVTIVYGELQEKKADFTRGGGYYDMNFKTEDQPDYTTLVPPGSSWGPAAVSNFNKPPTGPEAPTPQSTEATRGALVPPISYNSKFGEAAMLRNSKFGEAMYKWAAKEHGLEEHKGKTIPKEVKSLADRIRKKEPGKSDEYAYRTAWDIFRSYTAEGKSYPHKSEDSGLAREGGGTGQIKKSSDNFYIGFEKEAYDLRPLLKPITREGLSAEGLGKLTSLTRQNSVAGALGGGIGGALIGRGAADKDSKGKGMLVGGALGALGGGALGHATGVSAGNRLINQVEAHRQKLLSGVNKAKNFYKKDLGNWKVTREDIQNETSADLRSVPLNELHPHLRSQVEGALKSNRKDYSSKFLSRNLKNGNPRSTLNKELENYHRPASELKNLNEEEIPGFRLRTGTTPFMRYKATAGDNGQVHFNPEEIAKAHPSYAKADPLKQFMSIVEATHADPIVLNSSLGSMHHRSKKVQSHLNDFWSNTRKAHNSEESWNEYKKSYKDWFGGNQSTSADHTEHLKTLGLDEKAVKSKADIHSAWKNLARKHHPDVPGGDIKKMQEVNNAMDNLKKSNFYEKLPEKGNFEKGFEKKSGALSELASAALWSPIIS